MAGGTITPYPLNIPDDRAATPTPKPASPTRSIRPPSFSFQGSVQRLFDLGSSSASERDRPREMPSRSQSVSSPRSSSDQVPLITLKLSGPSFLDTVVREKKEPLYIIETVGDLTNIYRINSQLHEAGKAASIRWPPTVSSGKGKSGKSIQMGSGTWRDVEDFLKIGALGNLASRKFNLPHYPHTLKWKLIPGNCYVCTTSGMKGPIAVLDAATLSAPPRLRIYETLISPDMARSQQNHAGVPYLLLDYLVTTALLLTTTTQDWLDRPAGTRIPGSRDSRVQRVLKIIHPTLNEEDEAVRPSMSEGSDRLGIDSELTSPTTPSSSRAPSSLWSHMSWSSGSGSGGSEAPPLTPATTPPTHFPSSQSRSEESQSTVQAPEPQSQPQLQSQIRFRIANPEHTPDYESSVSGSSIIIPPRPYTAGANPMDATPTYTASVTPCSYALDDSTRPATTGTLPARPIRQLPTPPVQSSQFTLPRAGPSFPPQLMRVSSNPSPFPAQPHLHSPPTLAHINTLFSSSSEPSTSSEVDSTRFSRIRARRSIPPAPPPPQHALPLPLPPKLAAELERAGPSSHTTVGAGRSADAAPELASSMSALMISSSTPPGAPLPHLLPVPPGPPPTPDMQVHRDIGRVRASFAHVPQRETEADSIYEMPPPAYDAIDFSLRVRVPGRDRGINGRVQDR